MIKDVALITGAAGGIGSVTARSFLAAGFRVVGLDRRSEVLEVADDPDYLGVIADHRSEAEVEAAMTAVAGHGKLRHVVLLAAVAEPEESQLAGGYELPEPRVFRDSIENNLIGHLNVLWYAQPLLRANSGDRSVAFCSSVNALQGWGLPAYSAAKAGMMGVTHALTVGYGAEGIRINTVAPAQHRRRPHAPSGSTIRVILLSWRRGSRWVDWVHRKTLP